MKRVKNFFNKPIIVGFSILDISKTQLYRFHYEYMKQKFPLERLKLCYTDTDSLIYKILSDDIYAELKDDLINWFDTSDYHINNPFGYPLINKKIMGLMKDELKGNIYEEFVGLRSKMYSLKIYKAKKEECKAKRVVKAVRKTLTLNDYKKCLFEGEALWLKQTLIRSKKT